MISRWLCVGILTAVAIPTYAQKRFDCGTPADLFFAIDGSDSLTDPEFRASKEFTVNVLNEFPIELGSIHVGANVFGADVYDRVDIQGPRPGMYGLFKKRLQTMFRPRPRPGLTNTSGTATSMALQEMRLDFGLRGRKINGGNVTRVGIVITDGKSTNRSDTIQEAIKARNEGINMIAIGVGGDLFRNELNQIANSPSSVYVTDNVMGLVDKIKNAINTYICSVPTTTATPAPTTTTTTPEDSNLNDFDCPDCMIDATHGFMKHPHSCEKYIEILADANGTRTYLYRKCRDGLFWDQYLTTCRRPEHVKCDLDPCLISGVVSYDIEDLCSGYVMCVNKRSMRACCPINEAYVAGTGCVSDPTCIDSCHGDNNRLIHPEECDKVIDPNDNRYYIQNEGEGHEEKRLPCAPGTVFNIESCMCDLFDDRPQTGKLEDCPADANFTFENGFSDTSGYGAYAGTQLVDITDGHAQFNGNGMINIYRFSMDSFAQKLVLRIRFKSSAAANSNEALLTNCVYSAGQSSSVSIRVVRSSTASVVVFKTDTTLDTQQVSVPLLRPNDWNDAIYIYDGSRLYGIVDNGINPVLIQSEPLTGEILLRRSGIIIGAGSQLDSFTGSVDEFQLYKCFPAFADGYRS